MAEGSNGSQPQAQDRADVPVLSIVMPVYNEVEAIPGVLRAWHAELERLGIDFEIRAYNDGSKDGTGPILDDLAQELPRLKAFHHNNRGHGPTILRGYQEAPAEWVFQVDSDDEMGPEGFEQLWRVRHDYDLLLGYRAGRLSSPGRKLITGVARLTVRMMFRRGFRDVNTPYRLMRGSELRKLLRHVPDDTFAPNVSLTGLFGLFRLRVFEAPVGHQERQTGTVSIAGWKLWKSAARSLIQTLQIDVRARRDRAAR